MSVVVLQLPRATEAGLGELLDSAVRAWSIDVRELEPGAALSPGMLRWALDVEAKPASFQITIELPGTYAVFTEHGWDEFSGQVRTGERTLAPVFARVFGAGHEHDRSIGSVGISSPGDLDLDKLNRWLGKLLRERGRDIFRMKGVLSVAGQDTRYVFQGVHMLLDGRPERPWGAARRENRLVFIGRNLDRNALENGFRRCLV